MTEEQDGLVAQFISGTGTSAADASKYLEKWSWKLEEAIAGFWRDVDKASAADEDDGEGEAERGNEQQIGSSSFRAPPAGATSGGASKASGNSTPGRTSRGGFATLRDVSSEETGDGGDSEQDPQDFFAGGEKSGLSVQNPNRRKANNSNNDLVQRIINIAQPESRNEESKVPQRQFGGTGHTLGSDEQESATVPDPEASNVPMTRVTRILTFWRNGFSVDQGPLKRYDDPENQMTLRAVSQGRVPLDLFNVQYDQDVSIKIYRRMEEEYQASSGGDGEGGGDSVPFTGQGQRLGSPAPAVISSSGSQQPSSSTMSTTSTSQPPRQQQQPQIDPSQPATTIQIRLGDGTRLVAKFNQLANVSELYRFVEDSSTSTPRNYVLQTTFPNRDITDRDISIKDAGLVNSVIVQKYT